MNRHRNILLLLPLLVLFVACGSGDNYTPKPKGYMRIDLPEPVYSLVDSLSGDFDSVRFDAKLLPFSFEANEGTHIELKKNERRLKWVDIRYPDLNGIIFLSYIPIRNLNDLAGEVDTSYLLVSKHFGFASGISENKFVNKAENVYATSYQLKGQNVASTYQFWATDSVSHFLRGSLYIDCVPNNDSLAPVLEYLQHDMVHLIETLKWR